MSGDYVKAKCPVCDRDISALLPALYGNGMAVVRQHKHRPPGTKRWERCQGGGRRIEAPDRPLPRPRFSHETRGE